MAELHLLITSADIQRPIIIISRFSLLKISRYYLFPVVFGSWATTTCDPVAFRKMMCGVWKWTQRCSQAGWGRGQREEGSLAEPEASGTETLLSANVALLLLAAVSVVTHQKHTHTHTHTHTYIRIRICTLLDTLPRQNQTDKHKRARKNTDKILFDIYILTHRQMCDTNTDKYSRLNARTTHNKCFGKRFPPN